LKSAPVLYHPIQTLSTVFSKILIDLLTFFPLKKKPPEPGNPVPGVRNMKKGGNPKMKLCDFYALLFLRMTTKAPAEVSSTARAPRAIRLLSPVAGFLLM